MTSVQPMWEPTNGTAESRLPLRPRRRGSAIFTVLGVFGELLITVGILVIGFVIWQVWWQSDQAVAVAQEQVSEFHQTIDPPVRVAAELRTDEPPQVDSVKYGETFGVLIVPKWYDKTNNTMPIREGTTPEILDQAAAGHYTNTAMPGQIGNFSLAGHRRTHGNSFRYVNDLVAGDQIIIETAKTWYVYEVTDHEIVLPTQTDVVAPVPGHPEQEPTERLLTLTTCHSPTLGEWGNSHRWITHAKFVGWLDRSEGMPSQVLDEVELS